VVASSTVDARGVRATSHGAEAMTSIVSPGVLHEEEKREGCGFVSKAGDFAFE